VPQPPSAGRTASRLGALDALRFLAALSVLTFHFTMSSRAWDGRTPSAVGALGRWAAYGSMGVPLFFVISGFVVLMTAWGRDVPQFVASRVGRLFPAYWVAVVIAGVIAMGLWPAGTEGAAPTRLGAALNLTMLQGAMGVPDLDGPYWTLWTEARFYVLIAVFILVGMTRRRVLAFAAVWPVLGAVVAQTGSPLLNTLLITDYAPYFAGGMLLYLIHRDGHDTGTWLLVGVQSLFALHFALGHYPGSLAQVTTWPISTTVIALISFSCFGLVALLTTTSLHRANARWMTFLGALTYPLYLVHQKVGLYVIHLVHGNASAWVVLGLAVVVSLGLAAGIHYTVEKPLGGRLRKAMLRTLQGPAHSAGPMPSAEERAARMTRHSYPLTAVARTSPEHGAPTSAAPAARVPIPSGGTR
jgi:peptidoglycan/LPS O-acetylase OafA/YrhL